MRTPAELVDAILIAMAEYDADSLAPLLEEDIVWWAPKSASRFGVTRPTVGRDAVVRLFTGSLGIYQPGTITWDVHHLVADDTNVAVGMTRRSLLANGKPYENQYCLVFRHVNGRAAEGWEYVDTANAFAQFDN